MNNIKFEGFQVQLINLIKKFEGLSLTPYYCSAGKKTIGFGHVILENEEFDKISLQEAEDLLLQDLKKLYIPYSTLVKVELESNQHIALFSLIFNIGINVFKKSTLLKLINSQADKNSIKKEFLKWRFINKEESKGLLNRRIQESELFLQKK